MRLKESPTPLKILSSEFLDSVSKVNKDPSKMPTGIAFARTFGISYKSSFIPCKTGICSMSILLMVLTSVSGAIQTMINRNRHTKVAPRTCLKMYLSKIVSLNLFIKA